MCVAGVCVPFLAFCEVSLRLLGLFLFRSLGSASTVKFTLITAGHGVEGRAKGNEAVERPASREKGQ